MDFTNLVSEGWVCKKSHNMQTLLVRKQIICKLSLWWCDINLILLLPFLERNTPYLACDHRKKGNKHITRIPRKKKSWAFKGTVFLNIYISRDGK